MPSREQMVSVGESCSKYKRVDKDAPRSCASCSHWTGEQQMCALDIFLSQLQSLDQT